MQNKYRDDWKKSSDKLEIFYVIWFLLISSFLQDSILGSTLNETYEVVDYLGKGKYGTVYKTRRVADGKM